MALKDQLEAAGYDTSGLNEKDLLTKLDGAGYDTSSLKSSPGGILDKIHAAVSGITAGSASGLKAPIVAIPNAIMGKVNQVSSDLGEAGAVNAAANGLNPYVAAGAGTLTAMAPQLASAIDPLGGEANPSLQASKMAARSAGLGKMFNQTDSARRMAISAGGTALKNDIIPALGSPATMDSRVGAMESSVGSQLGDMRGQVGPVAPDNLFSAIQSAKQKVLGSFQGKQGIFKQASQKFDDLENTLKDLMPDYQPATPAQTVDTGLADASGKAIQKTVPAVPEQTQPIGLNDVVKAKKRISDSINWLADNASQQDAKSLAMSLETGISQSMADAGADMPRYRALKSLYGSLKLLNKGLDKEMAGLAGNSPIAARSLLSGALFDGGNPVTGAAIAGLAELGRRRGAGITANALYTGEQATAAKGIPFAASEALDRLYQRRKKS